MTFSFWNGRNKKSNGGSGDDGGPDRFAALAEVRGYWEGLRTALTLPRRDALDPRGMAGALHCTFVAERVGAGLARFRIAGMQLNEVASAEVRGLPVSLLFTPAARPRLATALERVFTRPAVADMVLTGERGYGRPTLDARLLLLPLVSSSGTTDLCLGCLALVGDLGRPPRRFEIERAMETLLAVDHMAPRGLPSDLRLASTGRPPTAQPVPIEMAEDAEAYAPPPRILGRPKLRLVKSEDGPLQF